MSHIIKIVQEEVGKIEKILKKIDVFLEKAPVGCLKWINRNGRTYYVHQKKQEKEEVENTDEKKTSEKWIHQYIKKQDIGLAKVLAQKQYYLAIKPVLEKNQKEMKRFIQHYQYDKINEVYDTLPEERKRLVIPIRMSVKERIRKWDEEVFEVNTMYLENLRYETEQGELVRSKSEVIIANILYQNRSKILYKYERPLTILENGREKTIYPDFTILNLSTGKVIYWEHAGRMDDGHYANEFVKKTNLYIMNGFVLGRDVVITYETQGNPLEIRVVKQLIKDIL